MENLEGLISKNKIVIFTKSSCPDCKKVTHLFRSMKLGFKEVILDKIGEEGIQLQEALIEKTGQKYVPSTFVKGWHIGGSRYTSKCANNGTIREMLDGKYQGFDYDLMVIGEGPGAYTAAFESARLGMKVAFCNYAIPTPENRRSGVTKRSLNFVCDPGKQTQRSGVIGTHITDASQFGWEINENVSFSWEEQFVSIHRHDMDMDTKCKNNSNDLLITYFNAFPSFESEHIVKLTDTEGKEIVIKAREFIIATSTNAERLDIPGSSCGISSEDIFCLPYHPGRVIVIGCSEAGLSCAGNLTSSNVSVTLLARKHFMEYFDQQMVDKLINDLLLLGAKVYKDGDIQEIEVVFDGKPGEYVVTIRLDSGETLKEDFNTIVFADGRLPNIEQMALDSIGVECDKNTGQIITNEMNGTTVKNIFALGSVCKGKQIKTFVSRTAMLLVHKLYGAKDDVLNIIAFPSLVSSSLDYGFVGLSEEEASEKYGSGNIEVYHTEFKPLEYRFSSRFQKCYSKLVCVKGENEHVVGLHVTGPYSGDVVQGFALGMKLGARKSDFQNVIGIHPTTAEQLTNRLEITKSSGEAIEQTDC